MSFDATPNLVTYNPSTEAFAAGIGSDYTAVRGGGSTADYWEGVMAVHREQQLAAVRAGVSRLTRVELAIDFASVEPTVTAFPEQPLL